MPMRKTVTSFMLLTTLTCGYPARTAQAGPLFDWLFGLNHHRQPAAPAYAVGYPVPVAAGYTPYVAGYSPYAAAYAPYTAGYAPTYALRPPVMAAPVMTAPAVAAPVVTAPPAYGTYYGAHMPVVGSAGYGYLTQRPVNGVIQSAPAVMPSTAPVTLVPDYSSTASRTPVTYYRPLMTTDQASGQQVVSMAPCTSYEYQTQRVPTLGLTQLYNGGATLPATTAVAPPVAPTYTLPRGGVPLAGPLPSTQPYATAYGTYPAPGTTSVVPAAPTTGSIITPAAPTYSSGYSGGYPGYASHYGNYSTLQPQVAAPSATTYPTTPYTGTAPLSPYYNSGSSVGGSTGGGSTGSLLPQTQSYGSAGSAAPYAAGPYGTTPGATYAVPPAGATIQGAPAYPSNVPGSTAPGYSPVLPPSSDPAAGSAPSLNPPGQSSARLDSKPQLQSVVQQPIAGSRSTSNSASLQSDTGNSQNPASGLMPIPVPDDFNHEPRWNPGLLNEQDQTAANEVDGRAASMSEAARDSAVAWGSKPIRWASLKQPAEQVNPADADSSGSRFGLELSAPKSRLRDVPAAEEIRPLAPAIDDDLRAAQQPVASSHIPRDVKMVPIESAWAPSTAPSTPAGLELSPSYSVASPNQASPVTTQPSTSDRYNTGGWRAK